MFFKGMPGNLLNRVDPFGIRMLLQLQIHLQVKFFKVRRFGSFEAKILLIDSILPLFSLSSVPSRCKARPLHAERLGHIAISVLDLPHRSVSEVYRRLPASSDCRTLFASVPRLLTLHLILTLSLRIQAAAEPILHLTDRYFC